MKKNRWRGSLQFIFGLGLAGLFFYMMAPFLVPILLGAILAILCYPLYDRFRRYVPRSLAALSVTLGVVIGILLPIALVTYSAFYRLLQQISRIKLPSGSHPEAGLLSHPWITKALEFMQQILPIDQDWVKQQGLEIFGTLVEKLSALVTHSLAGMPALVMGFVIVMLSTYFFLVDGAHFLKFLSTLSPMKFEKSFELYQTFERSCRGVVLGLIVSALVQGTLAAIFYAITGIPEPFVMGSITAVLSLIPLFGSAPITFGATAYLFFKGKILMGCIMLIGAVLIAISDNIVRPLVMRGSSELHPFLALVSVFGALNLIGAPGIFLGPIIAAVFVSFLKMLSQELRLEKLSAAAATARPREGK